jgi:hypothetical protein
MTTTFEARHIFDTDVDTYWSKVFFEDEFQQRLYMEGLKFKQYELLSKKTEPDGTILRSVRTEPSSDAPAVVKKIIGDSIAYVENGTFDAKTKRWKYEIVTSKMADKVKIGGDFWVEAKGAKKIERIVKVNITVKVFAVGGAIESFIEKTTRESFDKAAAFTNAYIHEKGLNA